MKKVCLRSFITRWGLTQQCCMQSPHEKALKKHCEIRGLIFCFFFPPSLSSQILSELEPTRSRMKFSFQRGWSFKFPNFSHFTLFLRLDFLLDLPFSSSFSVEVSCSLSWKVVCYILPIPSLAPILFLQAGWVTDTPDTLHSYFIKFS